MRWVYFALFVGVGVAPQLLPIAVGSIGFYSLIRKLEKPTFGNWLVVAALLGGASQFFSSSPTFPSRAPETSLGPAEVNLIAPKDMVHVIGWNPQDLRGAVAVYQGDGFWRIPRLNPATARPHVEVFSTSTYPVKDGQTYTESIYYRLSGKQIEFSFSFYTARGHQLVPAKILSFGNGLKRAYASYTVQPGDKWIRAVDLIGLGGDWESIDIGFPQLEPSPDLSGYVAGESTKTSPWNGAFWWISMCFLGWLVMVGTRFVLRQFPSEVLASALVIGIAVHFILVILLQKPYIEGRWTGFTPQPNFWGHQSVMLVGLVWLMGNSVLGGFVGLIFGGLAIGLSGSRAAFLAFIPLLLRWWWLLGRRWQLVGLLALVATGVFLALQSTRVDTLLDSSYDTNLARPQIWLIAWRAFLEHPIGGLGLGEFSSYFAQRRSLDAAEPAAGHAHNLFLQLLAEMGIMGLAAFLLLWGRMVFYLWQARMYGVMALFASALILNMFDFTWFYAGIYYPLWVALGWATAKTNRS